LGKKILEREIYTRKLQRLRLYSGEKVVLVRDFGPVKFWTTKEHPLNIELLRDKSYSDIERLFREGMIPLKSYDETLKTRHSTYFNRRWFVSDAIPIHHGLDFFNPASLNTLVSTVLLLFTSALVFLRGFDSLTGSFITSEFFYRVNPSLMILLYISLAYFIVSAVLLKRHTKKIKEKNEYFMKN